MTGGREIRAVTEADGLLRSGPLSAERARHYADHGAAYARGAEQFVAFPSYDPVLDSQDLYVPAHEFAVMGGELAEDLLAAGEADRVLLRVEAQAGAVPEKPFRRLVRYVARTEGPPSAEPPPGIRLVPADAGSVPFVKSMMRRAMLDGYHGAVRDPRAVDAYLEETVRFTGPGALHGLVAEAAGGEIGHITWTDPAPDEVTGALFHDLIDVHVLPEFEERAMTAALTRAMFDRIARSAAGVRGNVIEDEEGKADRLHDGLLRAGWAPLFALWVTTS